MNALQLLTTPNSVYLKAPKKSPGGCAIWDLAGVALMITEAGGEGRTYGGGPLHLNRSENIFFHDTGFIFASVDVEIEDLLAQLRTMDSSIEILGSVR